MKNENIYYINIKPYVYDLQFDIMIKRLLKSDIINIDDLTSCKEYLLTFLKKYHYSYIDKTTISKNVDNALSKKILEHLHIFFKIKPKPINNKQPKNNKTIKNRSTHNKTYKKRDKKIQ